MSKVREQVIKTVLDEFFAVTKEVSNGVINGADSFVGLAVDEVDTQILSEAINSALEKSDEGSSQS